MLPGVSPRARWRMVVALVAAVGLAALMGVGCSRSPQENAVPARATPYGGIRSNDGLWYAYTTLLPNSDEAVMTVEGPNGFRRSLPGGGDPRPISFSLDDQLLLFADAALDNGARWNSLFVLELAMPTVSVRQVTNVGILRLSQSERNIQDIPQPPESGVEWSGHIINYERFGTKFIINLDSGSISRSQVQP